MKKSSQRNETLQALWRGGKIMTLKTGCELGLYPFEFLRVNQAMQNLTGNPLPYIRNLIEQSGARVLFKGATPAVTCRFIKSVYRVPFMVYVPRALNRMCQRYRFSRSAELGALSVTLSVIDTFIETPLKIAKIHQASKGCCLNEIWRNVSRSQFSQSARAVFCKKLVTWGVFLPIHYYFKDRVSPRRAPIYTGLASATVCYPLSVITANIMKPRAERLGFFDVTKSIVRGNGARGMYGGVILYLLMCASGSAINSLLMHKTERTHEDSNNSKRMEL